MKSEVSGTSSQQYLENVTMDEIDVDYCLRNVSVQTGEEFSPQFLQNLTYRRKIRATGESSQELLNDCGVPKTIVQSVKEYREIPSGNVIDQYQQTRVEMQSNQNEKLVYEYQAGSTRGLQVEAEKVAYSDATTNYRHQDYTITGYHQNPQQTSTYNVQAGLHAYNRVSEVPDGPFSEKMKFLCSFGGRILTRPSDRKLRYVGGETRIISIKKNLNYQELVMRTYAICNQPHIIKYQLPGEDLDSLISVCSDDDFHHMIDEYQELEKRCQRLRIFLETLNERKSSCSSEASSVDLTDNALKYVVAVNGIPEPLLQKSSSRESGITVDSMTSFQSPPKLTTKLPNSEQFIQTAGNTKTSYLLTPSITMPVQYKKETNTQLIVGGDQVDQQAHESSYHTNHNLNNIEFGTYQQTFENHPVLGLYGQSNVDFKKPMINESAIESEKFVLTHKQSRNTIKEKTETSKCESPPIILNTDVSKQYNEWDQDLIRFTENKNSLNLGFDLDTEDCHQIVSPATPLERQYSIATTVSSDTQNNTSLEPSRIDVNAENPFLLTSSAENEHIVHDLLIPDSTIFVPICSDVSLGESSIDNLGDMSLSQTSDEKNAEDMPNFLPLDLLLSTIDFQCIQDKTIDKVLTRSYTENESVAHSHSEDVEDDKKMMDRPISDATMAEIQAGIHGLQTIRNDDLEELSEIGCGTFGTVYHGKWRGTDVAIKRIKESCFLGKPTEQDRLMKDFWREAQILSQLHHPNVVALYGVVRDGPGGTLSTVTEFMANGSLRHVLSKKNRSLDQRKKLMMAQDAAIGMEYLHLKNIVHFDLKCDNLLVNLGDPERPKCKVADFGLSRMKRDSLVSGGARGTLPWIAPELLDGSSSRVCEKVDVFSFGIVMWEILTGEEPYADMHCGAIIGGIVTNTLRPPIPRSCDHGWKKLMEECWSNDPGDRPSFAEITNKFQAMSAELQSKTQKRVVRDAYNHNHLRNQPRIL